VDIRWPSTSTEKARPNYVQSLWEVSVLRMEGKLQRCKGSFTIVEGSEL
jgi:hypothetical protein